MPSLLLAALLSVASFQADGLPARLDEVLARLDAGEGRPELLAVQLRDLAREDEVASVPHLRDTAAGHAAATQVAIARTLGDLEAVEEAADLLLPLAEGPQGEQALAVLFDSAFREVPRVGERLAALLDEPLPALRRVAVARALCRASRDTSLRARGKVALNDALESSDPDVRAEAAFALAETNDVGAAWDVLLELQDDPGLRGRLALAFIKQAEASRAFENKLVREAGRIDARPAGGEAPTAGPGSTDVLEELIAKIQENHLIGDQLTGPDGRERLIEAAARGMLAALDPHSTFFTSKEFERWILDLRRNYAGIGAYVNTIDGLFTITRPIYKGPAHLAGLLSGDKILEVNGWSTIEQKDDEIISRLKGQPDTEVEVQVHRDGWEEPRKFTLVRKVIHIPSVASELLPGDIGYAEVTQFAQDTTGELHRAISELRAQDMRGLILDLRNNSGGYLEEAVSVCSLFLPPGELVCYTEGRTAERRDYRAAKVPGRWDGPLVVLVNERSASASEIVSGALQDHGRAVVVGLTTYGKGSVQQAMALETRPGDLLKADRNGNGTYDPGDDYEDRDGNGHYTWPSEVKITNASYYLPSGRSIHTQLDLDGQVVKQGGVTPDREVDIDFLEPWENAELADAYDRLRKSVPDGDKFKNPFTRYVEERFDSHRELFYALAFDDDKDPARYPDFEAFKAQFGAHLPDGTLRKLLRIAVRDRVQDDRGKLFVGFSLLGDWQEDAQLQEGIRAVAEQAALDLAGIEGYREFAAAAAVEAAGEPAPR